MKAKALLIVGMVTLFGFGCNNPNSEPIISSVGTTNGKAFPYGNSSIGSSLSLTKYADTKDYAYTSVHPVKVASKDQRGTGYSVDYLNSLRGPNGEVIEYQRRGSCCYFETPNGIMGGGLLDAYVLTYKGCPDPLIIYLNMYDEGEMLIPLGLTSRK